MAILIPSYYFRLKRRKYFANKKYHGTWCVLAGTVDPYYITFVKRLTRKGCNLFLISDDLSKIEIIKSQLENSFNMVKIHCVSTSDFAKIKEEIRNLKRISMFILKFNEHASLREIISFSTIEMKILGDIKTKLLLTTKLSKLAMNIFEEQGSGVLINVSSLTSILPCPLLALNSAYNVYLDYLGRCLCKEKTNKDVWILNVKTLDLPILTSKYKSLKPNYDDYIERIFWSIGYTERTTAYIYYDLIWFFFWELRNWNKVLPGVDFNSKVAMLLLKQLMNKNSFIV